MNSMIYYKKYNNYSDYYYIKNEKYYEISGSDDYQVGIDFLPVQIDLGTIDLAEINKVLTDRNYNLKYIRDKEILKFKVSKDEYDNYIDLPLIYYPGYSAYLFDESGNKKQIMLENNEKGFARIYANNQEGRVEVKYRGTAVQCLSDILTIVSLIALLWYHHKMRREKM